MVPLLGMGLVATERRFSNVKRLFCRGKAHTVRIPVKDCVVLHDEDVSQDPLRAGIHGHEAGHAEQLIPFYYLRNQEKFFCFF